MKINNDRIIITFLIIILSAVYITCNADEYKLPKVDSGQCAFCTPLISAIINNNYKEVKKLIINGANVNENYQTTGPYPLHFSIRFSDENIVSLLIESGAKINCLDNGKQTPLHYASEKGRLNIVKLLIEKDATIDSSDINLETPLHLASKNGYYEIARYLIKKGANVNAKTNISKLTPIHYAVKQKEVSVPKILLDNKADINAVDNHGATPLYYAAYYNKIEMVKLLLARGAKQDYRILQDFWDYSRQYNVFHKKGYTAQSIAKQEGYNNIIKTINEFNTHKDFTNK